MPNPTPAELTNAAIEIRHHGYFINLAEGRVNPLAVPAPAPRRKRARRAQETHDGTEGPETDC